MYNHFFTFDYTNGRKSYSEQEKEMNGYWYPPPFQLLEYQWRQGRFDLIWWKLVSAHPGGGQHPPRGWVPPGMWVGHAGPGGPRWAETNYTSVTNQLQARASPLLFMTEATSMPPPQFTAQSYRTNVYLIYSFNNQMAVFPHHYNDKSWSLSLSWLISFATFLVSSWAPHIWCLLHTSENLLTSGGIQ